jgi:hypothetical protein
MNAICHMFNYNVLSSDTVLARTARIYFAFQNSKLKAENMIYAFSELLGRTLYVDLANCLH